MAPPGGAGEGDLPPLGALVVFALAAPPTAPVEPEELAVELSWLFDLGRNVFRNPSNSLFGLGLPLVTAAGLIARPIVAPMAAGAVFLFSKRGFSFGGSRDVGLEGQEVFLSTSPVETLHRNPPAPPRSLSLKFVWDVDDNAPCP